MFYTKYGLVAFYLSYLFPPEASTVIVKHLKRLNDFDLSQVFYIEKCHLSKMIPYKYILNTNLHCRLSSCPTSVIYASVYKNTSQKKLLGELNRVFSKNFENTSKMLTYICNNQNIFDFYSDHLYYWNNNHTMPSLTQQINQLYDLIIVDSYNYHQHSNVLSYETKSSRNTKYFVKDGQYHYLTYREYDYSKKITNKQFKQSIKNIKYKNTVKRGFRRNY
jgi:hypothetical protein